tara:strand:+ start:2011 stop:3279 length:1269 start_codon:yes stop_codon:yes gene_type:complete
MKKIGIIGLGYVGLPLAVEFGKIYNTIGFDINSNRVNELKKFDDKTNEVDGNLLKQVSKLGLLNITFEPKELSDCNIYIITVPTPIDSSKIPNLNPLIEASKLVSKFLKKDDIVIYESTVYPGCTEEVCCPVLEQKSGLKFNIDFFIGYSPERINPGDKERTLTKIIKVTSGSNAKTAELVDDLYKSIIKAGTFKAKSIKVAEAAKVIENTQRDINIAFVNELSKIFNKININTNDVLEAASTKWNFLQFKPGIVGGHCIGVDPYYLAKKAQDMGYHPEMILSGRRINDSMPNFIVSSIVKLMVKKEISIVKSEVLILGFTFKENCPDIRNTKVIDIYKEFSLYDPNITIVDPLANNDEVNSEYKIDINNQIPKGKKFDCVVLCVGHKEFKLINFKKILKPNYILYDVKSFIEDEGYDIYNL